MRVFFLILFIVYCGFGEAFLRLSESANFDSTGETSGFLTSYFQAIIFTFRMSLGDNNTDGFDVTLQPVTAWILFLICSMFTSIVMLNLLISIIGATYE
jgi:Ion transport protein